MVAGFNNGGSRRRDVLPMLSQPLYKCSICPRTFTNLQARGGHMTMHRQEVRENRRKHEEYMANKHKEFTMEVLSPNKAYWRYRNGKNRPREIAFLPLKKLGALHHDAKSSRGSSTSKGVETDLTMGDKDKGGEVEIPSMDLTLKL